MLSPSAYREVQAAVEELIQVTGPGVALDPEKPEELIYPVRSQMLLKLLSFLAPPPTPPEPAFDPAKPLDNTEVDEIAKALELFAGSDELFKKRAALVLEAARQELHQQKREKIAGQVSPK